MSDFKIIGNANPVVGVLEHYTVNNLFPKISANQNFDIPGSAHVNQQIKWEVYVLELGKWRKTKENDKTGNLVTYKFRHGSLTREGIRIVAIKGDETARLDIKPLPGQPKIDNVRLLDKSGKKIVGRLSYGQTVKARVHCLHMEKRRVYVTLWEDDVKGAGHNKANETNFIETKSGIVRDGIADVDFLLKPSFAKIATKNGPENDKVHEYYVTAQLDQEKIPSNNVNVNAPEAPVAPHKAKTTPKEPVKKNVPVQHPNTNTDVHHAPTASNHPAPVEQKPAVKKKINSVNITDTAGHQIKGTFREKEIKVWINSTGLKGKKISLKLYDDDITSKDLLFQDEFILGADLHAVVVKLNSIPKSKGDDLFEGSEQELFAEVEVLQEDISKKSAIIDVDAKVFKQDPVEATNKVLKKGEAKNEKDDKKKGKCFCNRDFEEKDVRKLVKLLKGKETIWEGVDLKGGKHLDCNISDKSFATLTNALNTAFKKYSINICIQKIHFLAQVCEETGTFGLSEEITGQHDSSKSIYKGRGLLQLTGVQKEGEKLYNDPGPYKDYADYVRDQNVIKKPEIVANSVNYCIDSGAWIWSVNKKMPNSKSPAVKKWGEETAGKSLNELAVFGDKYLELISVLLNGRNKDKGNMPNGWEKRKSMYNLLKTTFFRYTWYHEDGEKALKTKDVVTFHIYENGDIEKHIPKKIEAGYEEKYKYVYHDKKNNEHAICIVDKHQTDEKKNGTKPGSKPTHSEIVSDKNISEGQTTRRIKYKNGDIAEYGSNEGSSFWVLYEVTGKKVELVKMPDSLNYSESDVLIKYDFTNTKRRYSGPEYLAVFIGVLAKCGFDDVKTTGSCFSEASCFPSVEHVNGKSIDTLYLDDVREQKLINAFNYYGITKQLRGKKKREFEHTSDGGKLHNSHLHSGIISSGKIKIIKE